MMTCPVSVSSRVVLSALSALSRSHSLMKPLPLTAPISFHHLKKVTTMTLLLRIFEPTLLAVLLLGEVVALSPSNPPQTPTTKGFTGLSRRSAMNVAVAGIFASQNILGLSSAYAVETEYARSELLEAIRQDKPDKVVLAKMESLVATGPSSYDTTSDPRNLADLDGEWRLIWSINDDFSPLLRLPKPFKPESFQYFGAPAAAEVGDGRVAQGLTGGIVGRDSQLWLSSGIETIDPNDPYTLEIEPPFKLEFGGKYQSRKPKKVLVDSGSDADFRKLNARSEEAQFAGKNIYKQLYVERKGKGSLRISKIVDGDPVIVGAILIHEKL